MNVAVCLGMCDHPEAGMWTMCMHGLGARVLACCLCWQCVGNPPHMRRTVRGRGLPHADRAHEALGLGVVLGL